MPRMAHLGDAFSQLFPLLCCCWYADLLTRRQRQPQVVVVQGQRPMQYAQAQPPVVYGQVQQSTNAGAEAGDLPLVACASMQRAS